jgi:hypothetical protein
MVVNFIKECELLKIIKESDTKKDLETSLNTKGITYMWEGKNHIGVFIKGKGYSIYKLGYKSLFDRFWSGLDAKFTGLSNGFYSYLKGIYDICDYELSEDEVSIVADCYTRGVPTNLVINRLVYC